MCFNTQPREGGCNSSLLTVPFKLSFNTQPREGGCDHGFRVDAAVIGVSTHSRVEAAALCLPQYIVSQTAFQHTAARRRLRCWTKFLINFNCFNTQPPEGGCRIWRCPAKHDTGFNTQPPEGGCILIPLIDLLNFQFQHTAARRRLHT